MKDNITAILLLIIIAIIIKLSIYAIEKLLFTNFIIDTINKYYQYLLKIISSVKKVSTLIIKSPFIAFASLTKLVKILILKVFYTARYQSYNFVDFTKDQYANHKEQLEVINEKNLNTNSIPNNERIEFIETLCNESLLRIRLSDKSLSHKNLTDGERYSFEIELQRLSYQIQSLKDSIDKFKEKPISQQEIQRQQKKLIEIQELSLAIPLLLTSIENRILTIIEGNHE